MRKIISVILLSCIFLCGCESETYYWEFERPVTEVQNISIVVLDGDIYTVYDVLNAPAVMYLEASQYEEFYNEIQTIEIRLLPRVELDLPKGYCFLIDYGNNDYCILSLNGSGYILYDENDNFVNFKYMKLSFYSEYFYSLLRKYLVS